MKRLQSSEQLHTKNASNPPTYSGCMGTNRYLFHETALQKCRRANNCSLDYGSWVKCLKNTNNPQKNTIFSAWRQYSIIQTNGPQHWERRQNLRKWKDYGKYRKRDQNKQKVGFIFVWSSSELWSLFKYSKLILKNQIYSSWRPYSGRTVTWKNIQSLSIPCVLLPSCMAEPGAEMTAG